MPIKDKGQVGTEFLVDGDGSPELKTRVMTRDQKNYYHSRHFLHEAYGFGSAAAEVHIDERIMMSLKGGRSDDIVEIARRGDKSTIIEGGVRPMETGDGSDKYRTKS